MGHTRHTNRALMMKTRITFGVAALCAAAPVVAQEPHEHPDCYGLPFWTFAIEHWHYPEILEELTQRNGPRSRAELDVLALELAQSATDPDPDWVAEQIWTHFEDGIRADAEEAAQGPCYDATDVNRMVAGVIEDFRRDPGERALIMAGTTLRLAAHRADRPSHPPPTGIPYDGEGAFEAARLMFEEAEGWDSGLLEELDPERAVVVFERASMRPGSLACVALHRLRRWNWDNREERYVPHSSYERLRRESPERCPELDDPGGD